MSLKEKIINISENKIEPADDIITEISAELIEKLNTGEIRSAEPDGRGGWKVNVWVKQGILLLFKYGKMQQTEYATGFTFYDKDTLPLHPISIEDGIRVVPGGSSIRTGSFISKGVICMPPMYINIGAYVDEGTMIDSHALVGTCAQVGKRVHLSAAAQIGGVLEPAGMRPVIIEDDVLIGGNCGIYEGTLVRERAVLASGVILTASTKVFDLPNERIITADEAKPLEIPEGAVVVSGSRMIESEFGRTNGLSIYSPVIIKYRDEKTDAKTALEEALR